MGFYIRKGFRAGPIRFNLSKGGIGVSAGVKGARIGIGPRGTYVAGGRGGLYVREYLGGQGSSPSRWRSSTASLGGGSASVMDEFVDTGAAFPSRVRPSDLQLVEIPIVPSPRSPAVYLVFGTVFLLYAVVNSQDNPVIPSLISLVLLGIGAFMLFRNARTKKAVSVADSVLHRWRQELEEDKAPVFDEVPTEIKKALWQVQKGFSLRAGRLFMASFLTNRIDNQVLNAHLARIGLTEGEALSLKCQIFIDYFNHCIEDMILDEDEENQLKNIAGRLGIPREKISAEVEAIKYLSSIRKQSEEPLRAIDPGIPLPKNEVCYFASKVRVLKEKILQTRTQNGVKIKTRGHETECEGTAYLTNRRVLIVANGTKSYPFGKILDHVLNLESNILEMVVDGRKTPILLSMPSLAPFASKLERLQSLAP